MRTAINSHITEKEIQEQNAAIRDIYKRIGGSGLKYHITTYGCQMNVHDSEKLAGMFEQMGFVSTEAQDEADIILFNTCCVRDNAEQRVYGNVGSLYPYKQSNPNLIIGICGCMMQQKGMSSAIIDKFPFVDLVFGTHNLHRFPKLLLNALDSKETTVEILNKEEHIIEDIPVKRDPGVSAWVNIMYGCNNFCSYCIVPYVRGRERSRDKADILSEIEWLGENGYKEITLLGQNVNSYGKDLENHYEFSDLLRDIDNTPGIERVRFMTSHPKDLSQDLIIAMAETKKVCEHIHLPIQSGSDDILKRMNRRYSREDYFELVKSLRGHIPQIAITTDIIVGFPGETEKDFQRTLDLVEKVRFDSAYTFIYSQRRGTPAADMECQIPEEIKKERLHRLMDLQNTISGEINSTRKGRVVEVLVEGPSKNREDMYTGRTRDNKLVNFSSKSGYRGKLVDVKITKPKTWTLEGTMV